MDCEKNDRRSSMQIWRPTVFGVVVARVDNRHAIRVGRAATERAVRRLISVAGDCFSRPIAGASLAGFLRLSRARQTFYQPSGYAPAWIRDGRPTPQALAIMEILKQADSQGLDPEDYDGSRWAARLSASAKASSSRRCRDF